VCHLKGSYSRSLNGALSSFSVPLPIFLLLMVNVRRKYRSNEKVLISVLGRPCHILTFYITSMMADMTDETNISQVCVIIERCYNRVEFLTGLCIHADCMVYWWDPGAHYRWMAFTTCRTISSLIWRFRVPQTISIFPTLRRSSYLFCHSIYRHFSLFERDRLVTSIYLPALHFTQRRWQ
jgi:hypothetical protein